MKSPLLSVVASFLTATVVAVEPIDSCVTSSLPPRDLAAKETGFVSYSWTVVPTERTEPPALRPNEKAGVAFVDGAWYGVAKKKDARPVCNTWVKINGPRVVTRAVPVRVNIQKSPVDGEVLVTYIIGTTFNTALPSVATSLMTSSVRFHGADEEVPVSVRVFPPEPSAAPTTADVATLAQLRAALMDKARFPDGSTITLAETTFNVGLSADPAPIAVTRPLKLVGLSRTGTVLSGGELARCLDVTGADVVLSNLTVAAGFAEATGDSVWGVGIRSTGARTMLADVDIRDCRGRVSYGAGGDAALGGLAARLDGEGSRLDGCRIEDCTGEIAGGEEQTQAGFGAVYLRGKGCAAYGTLFRRCAMSNAAHRYNTHTTGAAYGGAYYGCTFESNIVWQTTPGRVHADAAAVRGASIVSNCVFRGNFATHLGAVSDTARISDSKFFGNVSSNGFGAAVHVGNVKTFPIVERCLFEDNVSLRLNGREPVSYQSRGGAIGMDYKGGVIVSNCVFRRNAALNRGFGGAIGGRSGSVISASGCTFDSNVAEGGGPDLYEDSPKSITKSNCIFVRKDK